MFDKEQNYEQLNTIIGATVDKLDVLCDDSEKTNNI